MVGLGLGDRVNMNPKGVIGKALSKPLGTDFSGICVVQCMEIMLFSGWNQNQGYLCEVADLG